MRLTLVLGKGHPIVLGKAFCVRMTPVSLEPRRSIKNKKQSKPSPFWLTDVVLAMLGEEHRATLMTSGQHVHAW